MSNPPPPVGTCNVWLEITFIIIMTRISRGMEKIANLGFSGFKKCQVFNFSNYQQFFIKILVTGPKVSRLHSCIGQGCTSAYMAVRISNKRSFQCQKCITKVCFFSSSHSTPFAALFPLRLFFSLKFESYPKVGNRVFYGNANRLCLYCSLQKTNLISIVILLQ